MTTSSESALAEAQAAAGPGGGDFDPLDPEFIADPHAALHEMRERCPVAWSGRWGGFYALTRRRDVIEVARNHKQFISSVLHIVPPGMARNTRPLMHSDPPEHTSFRDAVLPVYSGPRGEQIAPDVRARAVALAAELAARGSADLVRDYACPLMSYTLARFLGMDDPGAPEELNRWITQYVEAGQVRDSVRVGEAHEAMVKLASDLVADRRERPRDPAADLATALVQARAGGEPLNPDKIVGAIRQPFIIVWLATSHAVGNMLRRLAEDRGLQETLRRDPGLIEQSLEEFLRLDMPQIGFARSTVADVEVGGQTIPADTPVAMVFPAANRDPEVFEEPDEFRIGRSPNPHLTFGAGIHSCPGKSIARATVLSALEAIITGTGDLSLNGEIVPEHWPFRAVRALPVKIAPPAAP